jgi:hypothetical protein
MPVSWWPSSYAVADASYSGTRRELSVYVAQWEETRHELVRRLGVMVSRGQLSDHRRRELEEDVQELIDEDVITIVLASDYVHLRSMALRRVPRDERDWPTVALAIALNAGILTADNDFLGCGCRYMDCGDTERRARRCLSGQLRAGPASERAGRQHSSTGSLKDERSIRLLIVVHCGAEGAGVIGCHPRAA